MHVVIMGCGRVGAMLATSLESRSQQVTVIDQSSAAFRRLPPEFAGRTVTGVGFDRETLEKAGISTADAFAAASSGDNSNIIATRVARETFGVDTVVARIYDQGRAEAYERLGIPTVATVRWTTDRMLRALMNTSTAEVWRDPTSTVAMLEVALAETWIGRSISELETATGARVALVQRFGLGTLPTESMVLQEGDRTFLLVTDAMAGPVAEIAAAGPHEGEGN